MTKHQNNWLARGKSVQAWALAVLRSPVWHRRAIWAVVSVLGLWALGYVLVPVIVKSQIEKIASAKLGRQVTVGAVEFKPWSLELTVNDLAIATAGADASGRAQVSIKRIYINAELESLLRLAPVVDGIVVDEPMVLLTHLGQGRYDIDDVLARLAPAADAPAAEPPRFALYNLRLKGGQLDFIDQPVGKTHALREFNLAVPFLSNLPSQREVKTLPRLAFIMGGSSFDTAAVGTPFAQTRKTDATLKLTGFDLAPYAVYLPAAVPFSLQGAVLDIDAKVAFEQVPQTSVKVSGMVIASKVQLIDKRRATAVATAGAAPGNGPGQALLGFEQLRINMEDIRPLERFVRLSAVELTAPKLYLTRDRAGRINGLPAQEKNPLNATKSIAVSPVSNSATGSANAQSGKERSDIWKVQVASLAVRAGSIVWLDETLPQPAPMDLTDLRISAARLTLPFEASAPVQFEGALALGGASSATLSFRGTATDRAAQLTADVAAWPLKMASKYVSQLLIPALGGQLDAQLGVNWQAAAGEQASALRITAPQIAVSDVLLAQGKVALVSSKRINVTGVDIDLPAKSFKADALQLTQPKATLERDADKRWAAERWLQAPVTGAVARPMPEETPRLKGVAGVSTPSWTVAVREVGLDDGALSFSDNAGVKPVALELSKIKVRLRAVVLGDKPAAAMPLSASLQLASGRFEPGTVDFKGSVGLAPVQATGQLVVGRLPAQAFEPYFADQLNVELLRADTSFKGQVAFAQTPDGPQARVTGDLALEEFKANTLAPSEELLSWKALDLRGLNVAVAPARATQIDVRETALSDFFARVIITPQGRINLQELAKPSGAVSADGSAAPASPAVSAAALEPIINFGPISLNNGKVAFSDRFVKPNYSADLSDLTGKLSAFSSVSTGAVPTLADLELRGRAEGTASLEILGKLNPLAKPLALNISGKVRDLELPPLSPYSVKYAGYGITKGKLSVDVNYQVLPDGQLTAKNKVTLNQLSFGDKVEGSTASLPVKLAVALLSDRNGVIDIDLPISGSLSDPQFSLGPVIVKVIVNVIIKAITAPFSLLASALGGGDELSSVGFAPGSVALSQDARAGLDKIAKALIDRPSLQLTVVGTSDLLAEQEDYRRERLNELLRAEKRRLTVAGGGTPPESLSLSPAEVPALLKAVYNRTDMPKPRTGLGVISVAKDLPAAEMQSLILANLQVGDDAMRALALQRGVAVKDYLISKNLPAERLFLGAAKAGPPDAKGVPRAELNLALP